MSADFSSLGISPIIPTDLLSGSALATGATQADRVKQVSKAMEGMFAGQLMAELGKGLGGSSESQETGMYQDFIQQAMAQQVTAGGGFGLAKFIEQSITPATKHPLHLEAHPAHFSHASSAK